EAEVTRLQLLDLLDCPQDLNFVHVTPPTTRLRMIVIHNLFKSCHSLLCPCKDRSAMLLDLAFTACLLLLVVMILRSDTAMAAIDADLRQLRAAYRRDYDPYA